MLVSECKGWRHALDLGSTVMTLPIPSLLAWLMTDGSLGENEWNPLEQHLVKDYLIYNVRVINCQSRKSVTINRGVSEQQIHTLKTTSPMLNNWDYQPHQSNFSTLCRRSYVSTPSNSLRDRYSVISSFSLPLWVNSLHSTDWRVNWGQRGAVEREYESVETRRIETQYSVIVPPIVLTIDSETMFSCLWCVLVPSPIGV